MTKEHKVLNASSMISAVLIMFFTLLMLIEAVSSLMFSLCTFTDNNGTLSVSSAGISAADIAVNVVALCGFVFGLAMILGRNTENRFNLVKTVAYAVFWALYCAFFSISSFSDILYPVRLKWYSSLPLVNINLLQYDLFAAVFSCKVMLSVIIIGISAAVIMVSEVINSRMD